MAECFKKPTTTTPTMVVLPWHVRLSLFLISAVTDASRRSNGTINRRFFNLLDRKVPPNPNPVDGVSTSDVTVDPARDLWFRLFTPSTSAAASLPLVVYFHGGGFSFTSPSSTQFDTLCRQFCRSFHAVVVSVNYRFAPEHRFPTQYDDALEVLKFIDQNGDVVPGSADVRKCFLAGDSAGANIAHHVAVRVSREKLRNIQVIGQVSLQPFFGGEERTESEIRLKRIPLLSLDRTDWHWKVFLPVGSNRDHEAANVSRPNAEDISGLDYPNTLVVVGGFDLLRDWQVRYYEWLRKSGKEAQLIDYPNMFHGFYAFPDLLEDSKLISQVKEFMNKQISSVS